MSRRLLAALVGAVAAAAVTGVALAGAPSPASAATTASSTSASAILSAFNPADIISDQVMYNSSTMTVAQIQSFLNQEQPTCASGYTCLKTYRTNTQTMAANLMCGTYQGASNETAATIIYKVAKACRINPQVILVTLQKEQGLITGVNLSWYPDAYRSATGLGCPDTAPCDPAKYGFFNQVYGLGYWLIRYTTPPGTTGPGWTSFSWFPVGKASSILYNPDASCGSKVVTIKNKATASLYYYTPYVPNAAALAAGYGTGNSCSAYGNRNFFLYFTAWFGSTHISVTGAISSYWTSHGGTAGFLGAATANAVTSTANGGGTYQVFQHGTVYSSKSGTFAISGALLTEYNRRGGVGGSLQWPIGGQTTVTANGGGVMQKFGSGELYSSAAGTYAVRGDLRDVYLAAGGVAGSLGWPKDTASTIGTGWVQHFTKGTDYWNSATGGFGVPTAVDAGYVARKGPTGPLGWPVKAAATRTAAGITGTVQSFQSGDMYSSKAGTAAVLGTVRSVFTPSADRFDSLGWPVSDATTSTTAGGGTVQVFSSGRLYVPTGKQAVAVTGPILTTYVSRGEARGALGWPTSAPVLQTAGGTTRTVQQFTGGVATLAGSSVTTVTGVLYSAWTTAGGADGVLGWPTGAARSTSVAGGGWTQAFAGGMDYYSTRTNTAYPVTGTLLAAYKAHGEAGGVLGWPASTAAPVSAHGVTRTVQVFQSGSFTVSGSSVITINGSFHYAYEAAGGPASALGWPTAESRHTSANGGGWSQTFTGGTYYYSSASRKSFPVTGAILATYRAGGEAAGSLGWPAAAADQVTADGATKTVQTFTKGAAYQTGSRVDTINGFSYWQYVADGGPAGVLGWVTGPSVHVAGNGGGWAQPFAHGAMEYSSTTRKSFPVTGDILAAYTAHGAGGGSLGWPVAAAADVTADGATHTAQTFTKGALYGTDGGVIMLNGVSYWRYVAHGGPTGPLGWVTAPAQHVGANGGGWTQAFTHGELLYSSTTKQSWAVMDPILPVYTGRGGPAGALGWPLADATTTGSTTTQPFQHGTVTAP